MTGMDFGAVLERLADFFSRDKVRWALTGGFAMGALGAARTTADLDFLVHREDMPRVHAFLESLGYRRIHFSENVSQYDHPASTWGSLDFIHAFRPLALEMLARSLEKPLTAARRARVLTPEDVIGLKVQAIANSPARRLRDLADIEALISANRDGLDWARIKNYFGLFSMDAEYADLKARLGDG
ncbi:MAG: nucleotidyltransferase family protein [Elusimicrobia bacterium]|nr:nucleotidyltransferase family protein [Elusimicrobiota bacterium]